VFDIKKSSQVVEIDGTTQECTKVYTRLAETTSKKC